MPLKADEFAYEGFMCKVAWLRTAGGFVGRPCRVVRLDVVLFTYAAVIATLNIGAVIGSR